MTSVLPLSIKRDRIAVKTSDFWWNLLAWGLILLYIVTFTWLAILRHASFNSSGFDLGIYDQVVWNTLHGRIFYYTTTGQPLLHLSNHADPILLLVAPFYLIYSGPEMLLFLQAAAVGLGGLPLFWLSREKLGSSFAGIALLSTYLLFPTLQIVTLWDFHPPVLAMGFFMYAFYFLVKRKAAWVILFCILAMACKEQLPLQVVFLGLFALIRYRDWKLGATLVVLGITWFLAVIYWVIPANSVTGNHLFLGYYADLGDSPLEIVTSAVLRPDLVVNNLWQPAKLQYLFDVFTPFAYLPLLGLPVLLIGTPSFAINLLSANTAMHDATGGQYGADIAPWLAWSTLFGVLYLSRAAGRFGPTARQRAVQFISVILLAVALVWQLFRGFSPLALDPPNTTWDITAHDRLAARFIEQIPPDAAISAQGKLYPHLSNREVAYQFPDVLEAEYVFIDVTAGTWPIHPNDLHTEVQALLESGQFGVLDAADGYILMQRGLTDTTLPNAFYDFARVSKPAPAYPLDVTFGEQLRLFGYDLNDDGRRQETQVHMYWEVLQPIDADLRFYPFFVNEAGHVIEDTSQRPLITQLWYPSRLWKSGEVIVTETLPWALGEQWSLAAGVLAGPDWHDWSQRLKAELPADSADQVRRFEADTWVYLDSFKRDGRQLVQQTMAAPDVQPPHPVQANFADQIALQGYGLSPDIEAGQELVLTLYWEALTAVPLDYTIFVHVIDAEGQLVVQQDEGPWWEVPIPTSSWRPGEALLDRHVLSLPPDMAAGTYTIQIGIYYWETLERLPVLENGTPVDNVITLGQFEVK